MGKSFYVPPLIILGYYCKFPLKMGKWMIKPVKVYWKEEGQSY